MKNPKDASLTAEDVRVVLAEPEQTIRLVAQPIVDMRRGVVVGYETLSRFTLPSGKPAFPDKMFAAAMSAGLGEELEALVIAEALVLSRSKPPNCFLTINVDPLHVHARRVLDVLEAHGDLSGLILELTENTIISDLDTMRSALESLRRRGALIAIDDAGAGYSGLKQIVELRPQVLKIDRDLVTGIDTNEAKRALIHMLGELAGRLDAWVLAEGIETEAEQNALCQLGVPLGQGYLLGRPAPPWAGVSDAARAWFAEVAQRRLDLRTPAPNLHKLTVGGLVEPCATVPAGVAWPAGEQAVVVAVDETRRPAAMRLAHEDGARVRRPEDIMRVKASTSIADAALRASTRCDRLRWDPLVCIDDRGNFEGVVPMQRLVALLVSAHPKSEPPARSEDSDAPTRH